MKEFLKKNFALVLAFVLPIALIAVVAASVYLPSRSVTTEYNFIYSFCADGVNHYPYYCNNYLQKRYSVVNGKIVINPVDPNQDSDGNGAPDINENYITRIFLHDTKKNEGREITLEEAQAFPLNGLLTSPDGVTFSSGYDRHDGDFFPFFLSDSSYYYYLTKGKSKSKLNLINIDDRSYYQNNFKFLGWIIL
ncbi:MAG: hypothetical protein AAB505_01795 [Patescibacteria group bacterium]